MKLERDLLDFVVQAADRFHALSAGDHSEVEDLDPTWMRCFIDRMLPVMLHIDADGLEMDGATTKGLKVLQALGRRVYGNAMEGQSAIKEQERANQLAQQKLEETHSIFCLIRKRRIMLRKEAKFLEGRLAVLETQLAMGQRTGTMGSEEQVGAGTWEQSVLGEKGKVIVDTTVVSKDSLTQVER